MNPITIKVSTDDRARFERRGEPVAIGVSLPRGEALPSASWSLVDERDRHVPVQTTVLDRWGDQSIRWMLVEFQAVVPADVPSHYSLLNGSPAIGRPLTFTPSAAGIAVDTGVAQFNLPGSGAIGIADARVRNQTVLTDLTIQAEDGDGRPYTFAIRRTSITRSGPLSAIVLQEGNLVARDGTPWIESTLTLAVSCRSRSGARRSVVHGILVPRNTRTAFGTWVIRARC